MRGKVNPGMVSGVGTDPYGLVVGKGSGIGAYNAGQYYAVGDVVNASGVLYVCIQAGTGQTPSSSAAYWTAVKLTAEDYLVLNENDTPPTPSAGDHALLIDSNGIPYTYDENGVRNNIAVVSGFTSPGGLNLNGTNQAATYADNANLDMGTNDFTIVYFGKISALQTAVGSIFQKQNVLGQSTSAGWSIFVRTSSPYLRLYLTDGTNSAQSAAMTRDIRDDDDHLIEIVVIRATGFYVYVDGQLMETVTSGVSAVGSVSNAIQMGVGRDYNNGTPGSYTKMTVKMLRIFNYALSSAQRLLQLNNGDISTYRLPYAELKANQTALTSGTLVIGKRYRMDDFLAGDDFTNVAQVESGTINTDGCIFIATGTTPTTWTNSSVLRTLGCTFEILPENFGRVGSLETMNGIHGAMVGSPIPLSAEQGNVIYPDVKVSIANTATTLTDIVPPGYIPESVRAKGSDSLTGVKIGTSSGGEQIVASTTAGTTPTILTLAATANAGYSESASDTLYAEHATAGQTLDLIFTFRRAG